MSARRPLTSITGLASRHAALLSVCALAVAIFFAVAWPTRRLENTLGEPELVSGYALLTLVVLLALYNLRKRLSVIALPSNRIWTLGHTVGGVLAAALFWLHTGVAWPTGLYEQGLTALFYLVTASGLLGLALQQVYPRRLTQSGVEVIFERIPDEVAALRDRAEAVILRCTEEQRSDTLARFYLETLHWFFRRPRFLPSQLLGGQRAAFWVAQQVTIAERYLDAPERAYLAELRQLADAKSRLDLHYAMQGMMKAWLMVHVPAAAALLVLALWHLLVVNIYAL